jgi:hypothetical protein
VPVAVLIGGGKDMKLRQPESGDLRPESNTVIIFANKHYFSLILYINEVPEPAKFASALLLLYVHVLKFLLKI